MNLWMKSSWNTASSNSEKTLAFSFFFFFFLSLPSQVHRIKPELIPSNPYSIHYPHCFADCLLSPVLAQPAMEGVEVRWRPALGSSLAPLSLCSWLICASGVFVTVSLCLWSCVWPPRFIFLRWSLLNLSYDALWTCDAFFRNQPATVAFLQMFPDLSLLIIYYRR